MNTDLDPQSVAYITNLDHLTNLRTSRHRPVMMLQIVASTLKTALDNLLSRTDGAMTGVDQHGVLAKAVTLDLASMITRTWQSRMPTREHLPEKGHRPPMYQDYTDASLL